MIPEAINTAVMDGQTGNRKGERVLGFWGKEKRLKKGQIKGGVQCGSARRRRRSVKERSVMTKDAKKK